MTREEKLQKAHQMFDNRNLLIELKWQREYFKRGYVSNQEELFNLWIFDECIKALGQEPFINKPCVSQGICHEDKVKVLEDIKAEIRALPKKYPFVNHLDSYVKDDDVIKIIDKHMAKLQ